jgi:hypothetical protein
MEGGSGVTGDIERAIAESMARKINRWGSLIAEIDRAAESGPWRLSPEDVAEIWEEIIEVRSDLDAQLCALQAVYSPQGRLEVIALLVNILGWGAVHV